MSMTVRQEEEREGGRQKHSKAKQQTNKHTKERRKQK
jgi:hypothetical protein